MSDSLLIGVSGMQVHQQMLDVVGNNLANENTVGFKSQRVRFDDLVYQTLGAATGPSSDSPGGTNPIQVGLGVRLGAIDTINQQGSIQATGRDLDVALQGNGYFVARSSNGNLFTRDGAFGIDANNFLVDPGTGNRIQRFGMVGETTTNGPAFQTVGNNDIQIPVGTTTPGHATSVIDFVGNLSASASGPQAAVLTSAVPFLAGGVAATAATTLNGLDDNQTPYIAGDQLRLQGATTNNTPVDVNIPVDPNTTLGDIVNAINANFPGATASIDATGNLVVQSTTTGPSSLSLTVSDVAGNTGAMSWSNHNLAPTTVGKNGDTVQSAIQVYDTQGTAHTVSLTFQKQASNLWNLTAQLNPADGVLSTSSVSGITFNTDGSFRTVGGTGTLTAQFAGIATPQTIALSFGSPGGFNGLTQMGGASGAGATSQDGFAPGSLNGLTIDQDGTINGNFSNGRTIPIAQLAVASFANANALDRIGDNYYATNTQSGDARLGNALSGGRGSITQKALESSNVDVSLEFTQLIIAQRGFQVNARTITVSDQVLQDLVGIIR
jgi:flagellar hook protein FlgE